MLANAYGHAVRQLGYRDVDPELVRALVAGLIDEWRTDARDTDRRAPSTADGSAPSST